GIAPECSKTWVTSRRNCLTTFAQNPKPAFAKPSLAGNMLDGLRASGTRRKPSSLEPAFSCAVSCLTRLAKLAAKSLFATVARARSEEHTSELQSRENLVCR